MSVAPGKSPLESRVNLMAVNKIDPTDPSIKKEYEDFKADITRQALVILREIIPKKILYFNKLVSVNADPGSVLHSTDLDKTSYTVPSEQGFLNPSSCNGAAVGEVDAQGPRIKRIKADNERVTYTHVVPSHKQIFEELEKVKVETSELIEMVGNVKLWIQLNVPRIEDGNNFGVGIQEDAIQELARVEESAFNLYDTICKYYMTRAKLSTKIVKYPNVQDYQEAVRELDEKEWIHVKMTKVDMRNNYSMLYDLLSKNWEKVVKPKSEHGSSLMTF